MIQKDFNENNLVKSTWSGDIKKFQRKKLNMSEQKKEKIKQGKMKSSEVLTEKRAICVKSMEVKNIIPGLYTYYQLKILTLQITFRREKLVDVIKT